MKTKIGNGIECDVYDVSDNIVYKKFRESSVARSAFELQTLASKYNLAPKTVSFDGVGYCSEKVPVLEKVQSQNRIFSYEQINEEKEKLQEKLEVLFGYQVTDLHQGNLGITKKGFICIDFGIGFNRTWVVQECEKIKNQVIIDEINQLNNRRRL